MITLKEKKYVYKLKFINDPIKTVTRKLYGLNKLRISPKLYFYH